MYRTTSSPFRMLKDIIRNEGPGSLFKGYSMFFLLLIFLYSSLLYLSYLCSSLSFFILFFMIFYILSCINCLKLIIYYSIIFSVFTYFLHCDFNNISFFFLISFHLFSLSLKKNSFSSSFFSLHFSLCFRVCSPVF